MSLSIMDFHKISNGTYNAGEITLNWHGGLSKVNNHVGILSGFNGQQIDPKKSLEVKFAFVKALEAHMFGRDEELAQVRKELGLPPKGGMKDMGLDFDLSSVKPLTRAKTREIINRFSRDLNWSVGREKYHNFMSDSSTSDLVTSRWAHLKTEDAKSSYAANMKLASEINQASENARMSPLRSLGAQIINAKKDATALLPGGIRNSKSFKALSDDDKKTFSRIFSVLLLTSANANVNSIAADAMKKTLMVSYGKGNDMNKGQLNALKYMVGRLRLDKVPSGTSGMDFISEKINEFAESVKSKGFDLPDNDLLERGLQPYGSEDSKPLELVKADVLGKARDLLGDKSSDDTIKGLMNQIGQWRDIEPGELPNIEKSMKEGIASYLDGCISGKTKTNDSLKFDTDGICNQFRVDADGNTFEIGGERLNIGTSKQVVVDKLKDTFKNEADRKLLSGLMNQSTLFKIMELTTEFPNPDDKGVKPPPLRGKDSAGVHVANCTFGETPLMINQPEGTSSTFKLEHDKTTGTARLTISADYRLQPSAEMLLKAGKQNGDAFCKIGFTMAFNISGLGTATPKIESLDLSQKIKEA